MAKSPKTFDGLYDLMLRDQFLHICSQDLKLFLKERLPDTLEKMAELADQYKDARDVSALQSTGKTKIYPPKKGDEGKKQNRVENRRASDKQSKFIPKSERTCYKSHKIGHIASESRSKLFAKGVSQVIQVTESTKQVCFVSTLSTESVVDSKATTSPTTILTSSCQRNSSLNMPISAGHVNDEPVTVLRDTGCAGIVIRRSKVTEENILKGKTQICILADGSTITVPVAEVSINSPFLKGRHEAWCMENPVYDLIVGNVPGARSADKPDPEWQVNAVETRQQRRDKNKPYQKLKVPDIIAAEIDPQIIKDAQEEDPSPGKIREHATQNFTQMKKKGKVTWYKKGWATKVVPEEHREKVMQLAHDSLLAVI